MRNKLVSPYPILAINVLKNKRMHKYNDDIHELKFHYYQTIGRVENKDWSSACIMISDKVI